MTFLPDPETYEDDKTLTELQRRLEATETLGSLVTQASFALGISKEFITKVCFACEIWPEPPAYTQIFVGDKSRDGQDAWRQHDG